MRALATNKALDSVSIRNIHSSKSVICDSNGQFKVEVKSGELLEFSRARYKTLRLRIVNEKQPAYYVLHLEKIKPLLDVKGKLLAYQLDSLDYDRTFFNTIHGTKRGDNYGNGGSLDALSKQNRERWALQKMHEKWQNERYVNLVFNEDLVSEITYLSGEELKRFMRMYRPDYQFLRETTEYEYLSYIKKAYEQFKKQERY